MIPSPPATPIPPQRIQLLRALANLPVPHSLLQGVDIWLVASDGKTQRASLRLSPDKFTIILLTPQQAASPKRSFFAPRTEPPRRDDVDVGEMDRIQRGQSTQHFEKAKKKMGNRPDLFRGSSSTSVATPTTASTDETLLDPDRSFSIIFRGAHTLDLMAESSMQRDDICDTLDRILLAYHRAKLRVANEVLLLRYVWLHVVVDDHNNNKPADNLVRRATVQNFGKMLQEMNFVLKPRDLQAAYDQFGKVIGLDRASRKKGLTFEQSATFLHKLKRDSWMVKPVQVIWNHLFGEIMNNGKQRATVSDKTFLERFLQRQQRDTQATVQDVRTLFGRLHDMEITRTTAVDEGRITKDQFEVFLHSSENNAFDPGKAAFHESDMHRPLSEYWINSSHNTYLIGDQYTSQSSVEMYSEALYRGCRCLELDIWDGGKSPSGTPIPVVWHGHTMTTKVLFEDIIQTIKVFLNFHPDTFPIVLSFENHCSVPYQEVMAEQLVRIFRDSLYVPTEVSLIGNLPSPAQLRGMVVIKGRRPDGTEAEAYDTDDDFSDDGSGTHATNASVDLYNEAEARNARLRKKHGIAPQLARLTLFHGHKPKSFEESIRTPSYYMHSFSENKVRSNCRSGTVGTRWIVHNQRHMSRTYPGGARVDSSNYNPLLAWCMGCQMVALNFQTQDAFLRLNDGRFRQNGNCGYVLKPSSLMMKDNFPNVRLSPLELTVRVLSGACLPKPKGRRTGDCIDPYVKVAVYDVVNEERETVTAYQTPVVTQNGYFPIWHNPLLQHNDDFAFDIANADVAMMQLTVCHGKDEFIASASIPVNCLRAGIRSVKLFDVTNTRSGAFDFATLLVDVKLRPAVAEI